MISSMKSPLMKMTLARWIPSAIMYSAASAATLAGPLRASAFVPGDQDLFVARRAVSLVRSVDPRNTGLENALYVL